ncbi:MAG: hypothetical protein H0W88_11650 [Parachlamydiaceae bacterium]|nr:hypothetical protein [Parachlamydiaceae bacterium]
MTFNQYALSVVTLTSIPDALTAWEKHNSRTWGGRAYTVLTFAYLTPVVGAVLAIVSRMAALISKIYHSIYSSLESSQLRFTNNSPSSTPEATISIPPVLSSPPVQTASIPYSRSSDPYFIWLDNLPKLPELKDINFYNNIANMEFETELHKKVDFEKDLSDMLEKGRITTAGLKSPRDIATLKSQMTHLGWTPEDIAFILPYLSGPNIWKALTEDASPGIQKACNFFSKEVFPKLALSEAECTKDYGYCYVEKKDRFSQIFISKRYYSFNKDDNTVEWIEAGFRIDFQQKRSLLAFFRCGQPPKKANKAK